MYKVYKDPKGERYLEQKYPNVPGNGKISYESEGDYKKRIENLNSNSKWRTGKGVVLLTLLFMCNYFRFILVQKCYI